MSSARHQITYLLTYYLLACLLGCLLADGLTGRLAYVLTYKPQQADDTPRGDACRGDLKLVTKFGIKLLRRPPDNNRDENVSREVYMNSMLARDILLQLARQRCWPREPTYYLPTCLLAGLLTLTLARSYCFT